MVHHIKTLADLKTFAKQFAGGLRGGEVVGLIGDLGAGKTTFTQLLAVELGIRESVKSPTFILMQVLETGAAAKKRGVAQVCHVDAYRLDTWHELQTVGFEEYAGDRKTVAIVEWADRVPEIRSLGTYVEIRFAFGEGKTRILTIS